MVKFFSAKMDSAALSMHLVSKLPPRGDLEMDFCSTYPSCTAHTAGNEQLHLHTLTQSDWRKLGLRPMQCCSESSYVSEKLIEMSDTVCVPRTSASRQNLIAVHSCKQQASVKSFNCLRGQQLHRTLAHIKITLQLALAGCLQNFLAERSGQGQGARDRRQTHISTFL